MNALGAVPLALLQRDLSFKALAARTAGSSLLASLLGVALAATGWGAWALVARALALAAIGAGAAWIAHPYRPRLHLDRPAVRAVAPAGLRLWAAGLAAQVNGRGFDLLAGVVLGVTALGALRIAGQTVLLMAELTVGPMTAVGFALLARRRDDPAAFREAFQLVAACDALLIFPAFAGLFVVGDPLLPLMFGARWAPAAALLPFMCAVAPALYANLAVLCALFASGRTDLMLKGALVEAAFTALAGVIGARFGLVGLATAGTLRLYLMVPINLRWLSQAAGLDPRLLLAPALRAGVAALAMAAVVALAKARLTGALPPAPLTALLVALGVGAYAVLLPFVAAPMWRSPARPCVHAPRPGGAALAEGVEPVDGLGLAGTMMGGARAGVSGAAVALGRAAHALTLLFQLFTSGSNREARGQHFLRLTEGQAFERSFQAFAAAADCAPLLATTPDFHALLKDRARLAACAPGTFGCAYLAFMSENGFEEEAYMTGARAAAALHLPDRQRAWHRLRLEGAHDVRHVLTGYGPDMLGEACILMLRHVQLGHPGALVMAMIAALGAKWVDGGRVLPSLLEARRLGREARLLDLALFEHALDTPLAELQADLHLSRPLKYLARTATQALRRAPAPTRSPAPA